MHSIFMGSHNIFNLENYSSFVCYYVLYVARQLLNLHIYTVVYRFVTRLEPIMLLKLPIMLLSSAPKSSLLCSKLCLEIQIMLIGTVKFNTLKLSLT